MIPVLNKESIAGELANLCWLLNESKNTCDDSNMKWKIAQLASNAEVLYESFIEEFNLLPLEASNHYKAFSEKLSDTERTESLLSFAFNSVAIIDSARFEEFEPSEEFRNNIHSIRDETLRLLHEKKGWTNEDESKFDLD